MYERFRLPAAPVYGGFPVKFRTFLGDPIPYDPSVNAAELAEKVSQHKNKPTVVVLLVCLTPLLDKSLSSSALRLMLRPEYRIMITILVF